MLWGGPPPRALPESMQSTGMPSEQMRSARPPGRRIGPENRRSMRFGEASADIGAAADGRPNGCVPSSMPGLATAGASRWAGEASERARGRHGKSVSSK
eukprot:39102-Pleurochrysis_carterae.AAC.3